MKKCGVFDKIQVLKGYSSQFANKIEKIDFLFIDGDHSIKGCDYDFTSYSPYLKKGSFIAFHDYDDGRPDLGPTWVINNRLENKKFKFYEKFDSLWIAKKQTNE